MPSFRTLPLIGQLSVFARQTQKYKSLFLKYYHIELPRKYTGACGVFWDFLGGGAIPPWCGHMVLKLYFKSQFDK